MTGPVRCYVIHDAVEMSSKEVMVLKTGPVCGRYLRGDAILTVYDIVGSPGELLVCIPSSDHEDLRFYRCTGWALASYVLDNGWTLVSESEARKYLMADGTMRRGRRRKRV